MLIFVLTLILLGVSVGIFGGNWLGYVLAAIEFIGNQSALVVVIGVILIYVLARMGGKLLKRLLK